MECTETHARPLFQWNAYLYSLAREASSLPHKSKAAYTLLWDPLILWFNHCWNGKEEFLKVATEWTFSGYRLDLKATSESISSESTQQDLASGPRISSCRANADSLGQQRFRLHESEEPWLTHRELYQGCCKWKEGIEGTAGFDMLHTLHTFKVQNILIALPWNGDYRTPRNWLK